MTTLLDVEKGVSLIELEFKGDVSSHAQVILCVFDTICTNIAHLSVLYEKFPLQP